MDFKATDEQDMIREMVRDFAETVLAPTVEHRDKTQTPPSEEWQQFLELGLQLHDLGLELRNTEACRWMTYRNQSSLRNWLASILLSPSCFVSMWGSVQRQLLSTGMIIRKKPIFLGSQKGM